jgi:phage terminase small subunit
MTPLSDKASAWHASVLHEWPGIAKDPAALELLDRAAAAIDRIDAAQAAVDEHGVIVNDRWGVPKANPAVAVVRDGTVLLVRLLRELRLEPDDSARPPRLAS